MQGSKGVLAIEFVGEAGEGVVGCRKRRCPEKYLARQVAGEAVDNPRTIFRDHAATGSDRQLANRLIDIEHMDDITVAVAAFA